MPIRTEPNITPFDVRGARFCPNCGKPSDIPGNLRCRACKNAKRREEYADPERGERIRRRERKRYRNGSGYEQFLRKELPDNITELDETTQERLVLELRIRWQKKTGQLISARPQVAS